MLNGIFNFGGKNERDISSESEVASKKVVEPKKDRKNLIVVDADRSHDWPKVFENVPEIRVIQTSWQYIRVTSYGPKDCQVLAGLVHKNNRTVQFQPHFVLIRNEVYTANQDCRHVLYAFMHARIPSANSLESVYSFLERPVIHGALTKIKTELGKEKFPLIEQTYYSTSKEMRFTPEYPIVVKVGHAHAGVGKMKLENCSQFEDFASVIALAKKYTTAEHFYEGEYDIRVQKIGKHIRAFKRVTVCGNWKTNTGTSDVSDIPVTDEFRTWIEAASKIFGGLDICTVDAIHDKKSGRDIILEVNGTSSGFLRQHLKEDNGYVRDLVCKRMKELKII